MTPNEQIIYAIAQNYHAMATAVHNLIPTLSAYYEQISQNLFAWLRAAGVV